MMKEDSFFPTRTEENVFFKNMDWKPLRKFVAERYGINGTFISRCEAKIEAQWCKNIASKFGALSPCLYEAYLEIIQISMRKKVTYDDEIYPSFHDDYEKLEKLPGAVYWEGQGRVRYKTANNHDDASWFHYFTLFYVRCDEPGTWTFFDSDGLKVNGMHPKHKEEKYMLSSDGKEKGRIVNRWSRPCIKECYQKSKFEAQERFYTRERCQGHRISVRWPDGRLTFLCDCECRKVDDETLQIKSVEKYMLSSDGKEKGRIIKLKSRLCIGECHQDNVSEAPGWCHHYRISVRWPDGRLTFLCGCECRRVDDETLQFMGQ